MSFEKDTFFQEEIEFDKIVEDSGQAVQDVSGSEEALGPEVELEDEATALVTCEEEQPKTDEAAKAESEEMEDDSDEDSEASGGSGNDGNDEGGNELRNFFADCFIQYASYVIRDRAVPDVDDGLKPVQRRILYCMSKVDDGRFNKVAGVVGDTMHYHPHGDASIAGALVVLENKHYFIEGQGSFGSIITGMPAAAPRYIECRLTALAKEVLFNPEITTFVPTYDARREEPVCLPSKVPSLLMLGSDGICVGMATHVFPHNFRELLEAEIAILKGEPFQVFPDFVQGGLMDVSEYADGAGRIRVRAKIEAVGDKKVVIREIHAGTTTDALIESIEAASKRGKVKIASIKDMTAENVCIEIALQRGIYAEETIKDLYAYTDCEMKMTSDLLVIKDNIPVKMTVSEVLRRNVEKLLEYLRRELELAISRYKERVLYKTLVQIFVENKIYKRIENCSTLELIYKEVYKGLDKFKAQFYREINDEDVEKLLQMPIRRISAFDIAQNEQEIQDIGAKLADQEEKLAHLSEYAVEYIQGLIAKYADDFPRRTEIANFEIVNVREIARRDVKVYFDRQGHFVGTNVKPSSKEASPLVVTEYDKLVTLRGDGTCKVIDIPEKEYVGQTKYLFCYSKEQVYSILYRDRVQGTWYVKRFALGQYILGKEYHIIPANCLIEQLYSAPGVVVSLELATRNRRSTKTILVDFDSYQLRSREAKGFKLTSFEVASVRRVENPQQSTWEESAHDVSENTAEPGGEDAEK